ncbi:MAG: bile acid:sodium symporter family protein, partial [Rhodobacterales bacterium]|nr:bile acid:sodium symporter family protein [Rhodobacterales bacterium]
LKLDDFRRILRNPRAPLVGMLCQFLLFPAIAFALSWWLAPTPSIALGMLLVASCPGGNVSNFLTHWSHGDTPTSVSMTAISTAVAVVSTPMNLAFWGSLRPDTAALLTEVALNPVDMVQTVAVLLGIPVVLGMTLAAKRPSWAARIRRPIQLGSLVGFVGFVVLAFAGNFDFFVDYVGMVFFPVLVLNATALSLGWTGGWVAGLNVPERKAIAMEVGIQNSGLGLILVFNFFDGLGGLAVTCAWWGIWHIVAGMTLATFWRWTSPDAFKAV